MSGNAILPGAYPFRLRCRCGAGLSGERASCGQARRIGCRALQLMSRPCSRAAGAGEITRAAPIVHGRTCKQKGIPAVADVRVTYAEMETAAKQLITGHQEITSRLTSLKTMVDGLVQNGYVTDKSSQAFEASYTEFNKGVTQTIEGLEGMSKYLSAAAKAFGDTDSQLANALK